MGFIGSLFGSKTEEKPQVYTPPSLDEYVSSTARQIASMNATGDLGNLSRPETIVMEIRKDAINRASASSLNVDDGKASVALSVEEAMVRSCDDFRSRFKLPTAPYVHYRNGDADGAGIGVQNPPEPEKRKSLAQKLGL